MIRKLFLFIGLMGPGFFALANDFEPVVLARTAMFSQEYTQARVLFENILKEHPDNLEAVLGRMDAKIYLKMRDEAIAEGTSVFEDGTAEAICVKVHTLFWQRKRDEAKKLLTSALTQYPNHYYLNYQMSYLLWQTKEYGQAIEAAKKSIVQNPDFSEVYYLLGDAYRGKGDIQGVISAWTSYLEKTPANGKRYDLVSSYLKGLSGR